MKLDIYENIILLDLSKVFNEFKIEFSLFNSFSKFEISKKEYFRCSSFDILYFSKSFIGIWFDFFYIL